MLAYFRSSTRAELNIEPEDGEAIEFSCPAVPHLVLAAPSLNGSSRIRVYRRDASGGWTLADEFTAVPGAKARPPAAAEAPDREPGPEHEPDKETAPSPAVSEAPKALRAGKARNPGRTAHWAWVAAAALVCGSGFAGFWIARRAPQRVPAAAVPAAGSAIAPRPVPKDSGLGLAVREENGRLHVLWNRGSAAANAASEGALEIEDGAVSSSISLRAADITQGSIMYSPRSSDVTFRLNLTRADGGKTAEMIRVVGSARAVSAEPKPAYASAPPVQFTEAKDVTPTRIVPPRETSMVAEAPAVKPPLRSEEAARPPVAAPADKSEAQPTPVSAKPPIEAPSRMERAIVAPSAPVLTTDPQPLRQVKPSLRQSVRWMIPSPVTIAVLVSVDAQGRVTAAETDAANKTKNLYLGGLAVNAAREWSFKPATRNGVPIPGKYRIEFVFAATGR